MAIGEMRLSPDGTKEQTKKISHIFRLALITGIVLAVELAVVAWELERLLRR